MARERVTQRDLEIVLARINTLVGAPTEGGTRLEDGTWKCNVGTYVLDWAYGGVRLSQLVNKSGGERDITGRGTKRETLHAMRAFERGIEVGKSDLIC